MTQKKLFLLSISGRPVLAGEALARGAELLRRLNRPPEAAGAHRGAISLATNC